ncbi:MAG: hypothetical protein NC923_04255, partial [Candidatus Omnitrophica bacterium]|nr:hypothetical protein [Candidatus Omnitrophota bacterium]
LATSPATPEGAEYWDKLYKKAAELFGTENVTIPTLTRPWIVPDEVIISETPSSAYIHKATLKVMLEQDYLKNNAVYNFKDERLKQLNGYSSQIIRELIIPKLNQQINTSKKYASLRQVYYSLILSQWFKARFAYKQNPYSYLIESRSLSGLTSDIPYSKNTYFKAYQQSFKNGEYNYKAPVYTPFGQSIRSYFSGGADLNLGNVIPAQFGGIAGTNANGTQMCVIASSRNESALKSNPYLLAAEGKISLGELVVRITGNTLSGEEIQRRVQGIEDAHQIELDNEHRLGQRNTDGTYQKDKEKPYSLAGIREKAEILNEAGFDQDQRRSLMEYGIVGKKKEGVPGYFSRFKEAALNFLNPKKPEDITKVTTIIKELNQQKNGIEWPDSYLRFIAEHGDYLIAATPEDTVRWDYAWVDHPDKYGIRKVLALLGKLKLLGHGTIGLKTLQKEEDYFDTPVNFRATSEHRAYLSSSDFIGAVSLLNIILTGEIRNASVQQFVDVYQGDDKLYYPNFYGPFFVILKPGAEKLKRFSGLDAKERFGDISAELHYLYLVPRDEDKEFLVRAIGRAVKEGLITQERAQEAIVKLKTVTEFLEERIRGHSGSGRKGVDLGTRWYRGIQEYLRRNISGQIVAYYPGAGGDFDHAISATNADIFIFVDKYVKMLPVRLPMEIVAHGGKIESIKRKGKEYTLIFDMWGRRRTLYYYVKTDVSDETQLPSKAKAGYHIFMSRRAVATGWVDNPEGIFRTGLKYLKPSGFLLFDFHLTRLDNYREEIAKFGRLQFLGSRIESSHQNFCYFAQLIKDGDYPVSQNNSMPINPSSSPSNLQQNDSETFGGIDFRSLPIVTKATSNLSATMEYGNPDKFASINLDEEWGEIDRLVSSGITPSAERIKSYLQASFAKGDTEKDIDRVSNCISDILRQEEEKCCYTDSILKDILVVLEASRSSVGLRQIFLGEVN